jgi:hypothetical protein
MDSRSGFWRCYSALRSFFTLKAEVGAPAELPFVTGPADPFMAEEAEVGGSPFVVAFEAVLSLAVGVPLLSVGTGGTVGVLAPPPPPPLLAVEGVFDDAEVGVTPEGTTGGE